MAIGRDAGCGAQWLPEQLVHFGPVREDILAAPTPKLPRVATPQDWVRTCPYCRANFVYFNQQHPRIPTTGPDGGQRQWQAASCPACGAVAVFELNPSSNVVIDMHPKTVGTWEVAHLPDSVRAIWEEATNVFGVGANASAVVACGRTLEEAAVERKIIKGTLQQRIERMRTDGLITTEFKGAMDYVRLIRNVGAHAGKEVSRESAEGTMRFTQQTLRLLFEVPNELSRLTGHPPELDAPDGDEPSDVSS
jgi:hypothetical protein